MPVKRLKNKLLSMENNTATYKEMYEGTMTVIDPQYPTMAPYVDHDPTYYSGSAGFAFSVTHKLAQDKPTVLIRIPCDTLGIAPPAASAEPAAADFCLRAFGRTIGALNAELYNRSRPDDENGRYYLCVPGGEVVRRNTAYFALCPTKDYTNGPGSTVYLLHGEDAKPPALCLCLRLQIQLPKRKLRKTVQMLCRDLPDAVDRFILDFDAQGLSDAIALAEKQAAIRTWLKQSEYCAFVANGSILPRAKGTDLPLPGALPFTSPPGDEIELCGVRGMGIRRGVTVITGGGYSGKSTLLDAISAGIYDHASGDGRELCITDGSAVTISAEDGRSVQHLNISPFIKWLPGGDTADFSTEHASGSTSQAANIMEAIDGGAELLLMDEDRSATNFMIRDSMMKELIEKEPITPFTDRVQELYAAHGVSTILVIGGSGEYLSAADRIYKMEGYRICDVTEKAKRICASHCVTTERPAAARWEQSRTLCSERFSPYPEGSGTEKLEVSDMGFILIGDERIDVRGLHDIVSPRQLYALGFMLRWLDVKNNDRRIDLRGEIAALYARIEEEGVDFLYSPFFTECERFLDLPRPQELAALICRMRNIRIVKK